MFKTRAAQIIALVILVAIVIVAAASVMNGGLAGIFGGSSSKSSGSKSSGSKSADSVYELVAATGGAAPTHQPIADFSAWIKTTDKPILVDFWADWCAPCRAAAPFIESLATEFAGQVHIVKIDVDQETALAQTYKATSIPLFVIIKNGKVVNSLAGYASSRDDQIRSALKAQIS